MKRPTAIRMVGVVGLAAAIALGLFVLPVRHELQRFVTWVQSIGNWGPVALAAAYTPACLLFLPGSMLTLSSGFLFGVVRGTIAAFLGSLVGASAAFVLSRTLARGLVEDRVTASPKFRAIDRAVAAHGFKIVVLTRLSPLIPFNLLNLVFGVSAVRFRDFFLGSAVGMLPGGLMYAYIGSAVKSLADLFAGRIEGGVAQRVLFGAGLIATVVATVLITRVAKRALDDAVAAENSEGTSHA
jgi:uncharacterized membrane protein YdjX (TVP38/TMEM64 family)